MTTTLCTVDLIEALTPTVNRVLLTPKTPVSFTSGQYLQICLSQTDKRPFSIASTPNNPQLELHIGAAVADQFSSQALAHLLEKQAINETVEIEAGLGVAQFQSDNDRPIILLAGGTGFSYIHSIAQSIKEQNINRPVYLYWGVRSEDALYFNEKMQEWASNNSHYQFIPVVQEPRENWQGRSGMVHQAVLDDFATLADFDIYVAGPFAMAGAVRTAFLEQGAIRERMFADAFAYI